MSKPFSPVINFDEFSSHRSLKLKIRGVFRNAAILTKSFGRSPSHSNNWIRFPYYHHVFNDERRDFSRQLKYMRQFGEFISLDDAVQMLASNNPISGRYFCITFDDGFKNCLTNAVPILTEFGICAAFFLPTKYIGLDADQNQEVLLGFFNHGETLIEFLSWDDCRKMSDLGMILGSHTVNHCRLSQLDEGQVSTELADSKNMIEAQLNQSCEHFCSPFGIPGLDFIRDRDPAFVKKAGYRSMLTTERGSMGQGDTPFAIRRDHILAGWGDYQLRYFLSL
jgi:peptidoglycan/xylan/chitin deacetylase (PgdA/CDA1 family)